jgi:hypothetical protein
LNNKEFIKSGKRNNLVEKIKEQKIFFTLGILGIATAFTAITCRYNGIVNFGYNQEQKPFTIKVYYDRDKDGVIDRVSMHNPIGKIYNIFGFPRRQINGDIYLGPLGEVYKKDGLFWSLEEKMYEYPVLKYGKVGRVLRYHEQYEETIYFPLNLEQETNHAILKTIN